MKKAALLALVLFYSTTVYAADAVPGRPRWSFELKGGTFAPALENWAQYYGKNTMPEYEVTIARKVLRQIEIGIGTGTARGKGWAMAPDHGAVSGTVVYELYPLNVFVLARGVIHERQWLVPYIGGGWTRMFYKETVQDQKTVHGSADGYHVRGGLQLCLDGIDPGAANSMYLDNGVYHTYFFVETARITAKTKAESAELGGTSYLMGLLFEF